MNHDTMTMDARVLEPGDVFYLYADANMPLRLVVRTRQLLAVTEILHGDPKHPGGLEYTLFSHGGRVLVPLLT